MVIQFYAHSGSRSEQSDWQPLREHLIGTGWRAERYASVFGADMLAMIAGRLHDLGKYTESFQSRFRGEVPPCSGLAVVHARELRATISVRLPIALKRNTSYDRRAQGARRWSPMSQPKKEEGSSYSISLKLDIRGREKPAVWPWVIVVLITLCAPWLGWLLKQVL
ncbi:CRISPR-associated endonuclease Cas3'' [Dokdonella koreensis]|uniref:CRISPR-associated endonuclease Cas3'' n=1 Tax=Dokdonella koreensis TaxID=323415 RepID=UPI00123794F6|nr:CRISPR-associated endonuclease Cas3'' [Dokdonella koreensis]